MKASRNFALATLLAALATPALAAEAGIADCPPVDQLVARQNALRDKSAASAAMVLRAPSDTALHDELLKLQANDQQARAALSQSAQANGGRPEQQAMMQAFVADSENLARLKEIVDKGGFPDAAKVGREGVAAAWLIVQHADRDTDFQARMLAQMKPLADRGDLAAQDYAMLDDRVQIAQGHPQKFGSQFRALDGVNHPQPIADQAGLDARRAKLGMLPMREYGCILQQVYGIPVDLKPHGMIVRSQQATLK